MVHTQNYSKNRFKNRIAIQKASIRNGRCFSYAQIQEKRSLCREVESRGITVEIGGDTTKLQTALKAVEITIPPILLDKKVNETRIMPKAEARFFEIQYIYEAECIQRNFSTTNALVLDLGINNLVTGLSSKGETFIIDGRRQ